MTLSSQTEPCIAGWLALTADGLRRVSLENDGVTYPIINGASHSAKSVRVITSGRNRLDFVASGPGHPYYSLLVPAARNRR
jgi:hypothetical protein